MSLSDKCNSMKFGLHNTSSDHYLDFHIFQFIIVDIPDNNYEEFADVWQHSECFLCKFCDSRSIFEAFIKFIKSSLNHLYIRCMQSRSCGMPQRFLLWEVLLVEHVACISSAFFLQHAKHHSCIHRQEQYLMYRFLSIIPCLWSDFEPVASMKSKRA
jgi:hypothetical protein